MVKKIAKDPSIEALDMIKNVYDEKKAEINGRIYVILNTTHKKRRKIFAFFSKYQSQVVANDYSFLESDDFDLIEGLINNLVSFNGDLISRIPDHWEKYPEDYVLFIVTMLGAMSYPFFRGVVGG